MVCLVYGRTVYGRLVPARVLNLTRPFKTFFARLSYGETVFFIDRRTGALPCVASALRKRSVYCFALTISLCNQRFGMRKHHLSGCKKD